MNHTKKLISITKSVQIISASLLFTFLLNNPELPGLIHEYSLRQTPS